MFREKIYTLSKMDNLESQRGIPEPTLKIFHKQIMEMDDFIENKHQSIKPSQEAKIDALIYAASQLSFQKVLALVSPNVDEEEIEWVAKSVIQWENAIEGAKKNDWSAMISVLQDYARSAFPSAAIRESLRENNPQIASGDQSQKRADAFVNLISSL